jgi:hypothetical protein
MISYVSKMLGNSNMTESSFDKIKKLIKTIGGKVIIVEDGMPSIVIADIDEYINFKKVKNPPFDPNNGNNGLSRKESLGKINKDISIWKNRQEEKKINQLENNLKIENLKDSKNGFQNAHSEDTEDNNNKADNNKADEIVIEKLE